VVSRDSLVRQLRDSCHKYQTHVLYQILQESFLNPGFCNFWVQFDSFNVSDSCHVVL